MNFEDPDVNYQADVEDSSDESDNEEENENYKQIFNILKDPQLPRSTNFQRLNYLPPYLYDISEYRIIARDIIKELDSKNRTTLHVVELFRDLNTLIFHVPTIIKHPKLVWYVHRMMTCEFFDNEVGLETRRVEKLRDTLYEHVQKTYFEIYKTLLHDHRHFRKYYYRGGYHNRAI